MPLSQVQGFAGLIPALDQLLIRGEIQHAVVVFVDGLGWRFSETELTHPFLRAFQRAGELRPLPSQFPSTTTAHVSSFHTGLPVGEHGLYEWRLLDPGLGRIIRPLRFDFDDGQPFSLESVHLDPFKLLGVPARYPRLRAAGISSHLWYSPQILLSPYNQAALEGACVHPYSGLKEGLLSLRARVAGADQPSFNSLYIPGLDTVSHLHGPGSGELQDCLRAHLDLFFSHLLGARAPAWPSGTLLVLCSDHGQIEVSVEETDMLDLEEPRLLEWLREDPEGRPLGPAGAGRDAFLHLKPEHLEQAYLSLSERLAGRAQVHRCEEMMRDGWFGADCSQRLRARMADLYLEPVPGRQAWLTPPHAPSISHLRGQHGGRTPQESLTTLGSLTLS